MAEEEEEERAKRDLEKAAAFSRLMNESRRLRRTNFYEQDNRNFILSAETPSKVSERYSFGEVLHASVVERKHKNSQVIPSDRRRASLPHQKPVKRRSELDELQRKIQDLTQTLDNHASRRKKPHSVIDSSYEESLERTRDLTELHKKAVESIVRFAKQVLNDGKGRHYGPETRSLVHQLALLAERVGLSGGTSMPSSSSSASTSLLSPFQYQSQPHEKSHSQSMPTNQRKSLGRNSLAEIVLQRILAKKRNPQKSDSKTTTTTTNEQQQQQQVLRVSQLRQQTQEENDEQRNEKRRMNGRAMSLIMKEKKTILINLDLLSELIFDLMLDDTILELDRIEKEVNKPSQRSFEGHPKEQIALRIPEKMAEVSIGNIFRHHEERAKWNYSLAKFRYGTDDLAKMIEQLTEMILNDIVGNIAANMFEIGDDIVDSLIESEFA